MAGIESPAINDGLDRLRDATGKVGELEGRLQKLQARLALVTQKLNEPSP